MTVEFMPTGRDIVDPNGDVRHISDLTHSMLEEEVPQETIVEGGALTVEQATDVLTWLHTGLNSHERARGYRDRVGLGRTAWQASSRNPRDFVACMDKPLLTLEEAAAALDAAQDR